MMAPPPPRSGSFRGGWLVGRGGLRFEAPMFVWACRVGEGVGVFFFSSRVIFGGVGSGYGG